MSEQAAIAEKTDRGVLCAKCEHLNPRRVSACERCGGHLYVSCVDCGHRNERVLSRCAACRRRLHRGSLERLTRRLVGKNFAVTPMTVFLFLAGIALVFGLIVLVSNFKLG